MQKLFFYLSVVWRFIISAQGSALQFLFNANFLSEQEHFQGIALIHAVCLT